jgi:putative acetyltransferase
VLAEYGMQPEHDGIDQDLLAPASTYQGGFFDAVRDKQQCIVGTVAVLPISATDAELRRMYLAADARGNGLGRACLGYALQRARRLGFRTLHMETASVLHEALGLYAWAGFSPQGGSLHAKRCDQSLILHDF